MKASTVLIALCLPLLTAACATHETRTVTVPATLLAECPVPEWSGKTYRDLAELAERRKTALDDCNAQLEAARDYQNRVKEPG